MCVSNAGPTCRFHQHLFMLIYWGRVTHICVNKLPTIGSGNDQTPSHYLNQSWNIVNLTLKNKLHWNLNRNAFEYDVWKVAAILSGPLLVNRHSITKPPYVNSHFNLLINRGCSVIFDWCMINASMVFIGVKRSRGRGRFTSCEIDF